MRQKNEMKTNLMFRMVILNIKMYENRLFSNNKGVLLEFIHRVVGEVKRILQSQKPKTPKFSRNRSFYALKTGFCIIFCGSILLI